jgi:hypothetical protein
MSGGRLDWPRRDPFDCPLAATTRHSVYRLVSPATVFEGIVQRIG